jgi:hypothetical protein
MKTYFQFIHANVWCMIQNINRLLEYVTPYNKKTQIACRLIIQNTEITYDILCGSDRRFQFQSTVYAVNYWIICLKEHNSAIRVHACMVLLSGDRYFETSKVKNTFEVVCTV